MFCSECGKKLFDRAKFCINCGAKINYNIEEIEYETNDIYNSCEDIVSRFNKSKKRTKVYNDNRDISREFYEFFKNEKPFVMMGESAFFIEENGMCVCGTVLNREIEVGDYVAVLDDKSMLRAEHVEVIGIVYKKNLVDCAYPEDDIGLLLDLEKNIISKGCLIVAESI